MKLITFIKNVSIKTLLILAKQLFRDGHQWAVFLKKFYPFYQLGNDCYIDFSVQFEEPYLTKIGDNVWLTDGVIVLNHDGALSMLNRYTKQRAHKFGSVQIGNNVFIGMRSILMPGITIGDNVLAAAGSIVTKDVRSGMVIGGNPAVEIGTTETYYKKWKNKQFFQYLNQYEKQVELTQYFWES